MHAESEKISTVQTSTVPTDVGCAIPVVEFPDDVSFDVDVMSASSAVQNRFDSCTKIIRRTVADVV